MSDVDKLQEYIRTGSRASAMFTEALAAHTSACALLNAAASEAARLTAHEALDALMDTTWHIHILRKQHADREKK